MSDAAAIALLLAVVIAVAVLVTRVYNARVAGPPHVWEVTEKSWEGTVEVSATCPGEEALVVGLVRWDDPAFTSKIEEVRSEARFRVAALNSPGGMTKCLP